MKDFISFCGEFFICNDLICGMSFILIILKYHINITSIFSFFYLSMYSINSKFKCIPFHLIKKNLSKIFIKDI